MANLWGGCRQIPRGTQYEVGIAIQVFWCGSEALGGPECDLGIHSLPPASLKESLHSMTTPLDDERSFQASRPSRNNFLDTEFGAQPYDEFGSEYSQSSDRPEGSLRPEGLKDEDRVNSRNRKQDDDFETKAVKSGWSDWASASQQCIGLDENQFYSLQIMDFFQELEIKYDCVSNASQRISKCEEFESMVKESRIPLLHLRHGALPGRGRSDFLGEPSTASIIIKDPERGWWFLAFFNPALTSKHDEGNSTLLTEGDDEMCLQLKWRARTCGSGRTGDDCQWPVLLLEVRILSAMNCIWCEKRSIIDMFCE